MLKTITTPLRSLLALLTIITLCGQTSVFAQGHDEEAHSTHQEETKKPFNAGEMIMHHISDAHEIHIIGDLAIYLPVIIYGDNGIEVFSSSHFYHNEMHGEYMHDGEVESYHYGEHNGYVLYHEHIYIADANGGVSFDPETGKVTNASAFDLSITKSVAGVMITCILLILIFGSVARGYKKREGQAPKGLQSFMEPMILFIRDEVAVPSIGAKKADRYMPFLLTSFFFIWIANMLGLIPFLGGFNITGTLAVTMVLAGIVFIITTFSGNKHYWGHLLWPPGVPTPIKFILVPIEIAGIFIKPLVLMIRLTANITAGHIIILAFVSLILIFGETSVTAGYGVGIGSTLFMIFMFFIELLVAFLQAYVFTLLAALYFGDATQEAHH
jgi:F-type H+-transporting ATPase subunit a